MPSTCTMCPSARPTWPISVAREYARLPGAPVPVSRVSAAPVLTVAPCFATNVEPLQSCAGDSCIDLPPQGSNVVYLHTEPRTDARLVRDPVLHSDGSPGHHPDRRLVGPGGRWAVLRCGRTKPQWTAIWFGSRLAGLDNPSRRVSAPGRSALVTHRLGVRPSLSRRRLPTQRPPPTRRRSQ
jgi:hypothetical protein